MRDMEMENMISVRARSCSYSAVLGSCRFYTRTSILMLTYLM